MSIDLQDNWAKDKRKDYKENRTMDKFKRIKNKKKRKK